MNLERRPAVGVYCAYDIDFTKYDCAGFCVVSTSSIVALAMQALSIKIKNFPDFTYDKDLLLSGDNDEMAKVNRAISIRRKQIGAFLRLEFGRLINLANFGNVKNGNFELLDKMSNLRKIVSDSISPFFKEKDFILYGRPLDLKIPSSYVVGIEDFSEALDEARKRRRRFEEICSEQNYLSIQRSNFEWRTNELLVPVRAAFQTEIMTEVKHYQSFSEFDLAIQLLMHLGARKTQDLWGERCKKPNAELIRAEIKRLARELDEYFRQIQVDAATKEIDFPFKKMNGFLGDPFCNNGKRSELDLSCKEYLKDAGEIKMIVREKHSGKKVIFARVGPEISALYSKAFCNLHYANPGEIAVFGAYLEGDELPFAYSSYGRISYDYTKDMLSYMGYGDGEIIESSRAWNAPFAPENTMSALFSYSHARIAEDFPTVRGILTAINPNLGFTASAFRGVHFEIVSLKPTVFSYQLKNGLPYFCPKRDIAKDLNIHIDALMEGEHYIDNQIPFLPTIEMLYLYDKNERKKLIDSPIYVVSKNEYLHNR